MTSRERFLSACSRLHKRQLSRPPIWVMRQAGRYLPEYRALKEKTSFLEMVRTPELAMEVTLQPLRRFPGLDAAILFSDILVIPEALGQAYAFRDGGGIQMERRLGTAADIQALASPEAVLDRLQYVDGALKLLRKELGSEKTLLGFGGSPWTLAAYMIEGGSSPDFARAHELMRSAPEAFDTLLSKLTAALIVYFRMQIAAGADAIQIFDSWGGVLAPEEYEAGSLMWIRRIVDALPKDFPIILYAKGTSKSYAAQARTGISVLSVDWETDLPALRRKLPDTVAVQGNLDPVIMTTSPETVEQEAGKLLSAMDGLPGGHIFNLGHGITPDAKIECMHALVDTVVNFNPVTSRRA